MKPKTLLLSTFIITSLTTTAGNRVIRGTVIDKDTNEPVIGASVRVKGAPAESASTGLDGSFRISTSASNPVIICDYIGYKTAETAANGAGPVQIRLTELPNELAEVVVTARAAGNSEAAARMLERNSMNVVNVISGKAMALSPDITVGNIIQRMSGVTVERNSTGEGQYAILRGMDKRYNYTLVNGIKVPSPDNKNRFVPLDLFPSEILDRIEVAKSLTANLEGDGIGGAVNLVMKEAPSSRMFSANLSTGYNALFLDRDFLSFNHGAASRRSPNEIKGTSGDYGVTASDFSQASLRVKRQHALPDITAGAAYGDRFLGNRLGLIAAASYQSVSRGKDSDWYYRQSYPVYGIERREYSERQQRLALHVKPDFIITPGHKLSWYNGMLDMRETQTRVARNDKTSAVRLKWDHQYIFNSTLSGSHMFRDGNLTLEWKGVYSKAYDETPDNALINIQGNHLATSGAATRRWEHNSDRDWAGYADFGYHFSRGGGNYDLSAGAMYRDKKRRSFFNEYTFDSATGPGTAQVFGRDWDNFDGILITPREFGNVGDPLNYDAYEKIGAAYVMAKMSLRGWELIAGLRMEHTDQGYVLLFPRDTDPEGRQRYADWLPDFHAKWQVNPRMNLRFSYARAINRPSFFEIVPYSIINEEYKEKGNPGLKHTVADNIDLRWEYFPKSSEQFMAGVFFKHLANPIEYGLINEGQDTYFMPMNLGNATNMGAEIDILKYFDKFGIKANYTFTHSRITTEKRLMRGNEIVRVSQTRPLYGQAAHVANLSLLFKDTRHGWEAQLATSYIGKRLCDISNWYDNDIWENDYFRIELSAEKEFRCGLSIFLKATNLLNLPMIRYYHKGPHTDTLTDVERINGNVVERKEYYGQTLMTGIRFNLK